MSFMSMNFDDAHEVINFAVDFMPTKGDKIL